MSVKPYGLLCPISRACELLEPRWTIQIALEVLAGTSRFNEIRRNLGGISPGVLSKRLSEMEASGLVQRVESRAAATVDYLATEKTEALEPVLNAMAVWAQQNIEADLALVDSSVSNMMWTVRRNLKVDFLPPKRSVIRFHFMDDELEYDTYWYLAQRGIIPELCVYDPGLDVDLYIETTSVALGGIIMGRTTMAKESESGSFFLSGDPRLVRTINKWFPPSPYSHIPNIPQLDGPKGAVTK